MTANKYEAQTVVVDGQEITYHKIDSDQNGNPRYVVHFLALGIKQGDYGKVPKLEKYRAKWFAGGIVFQSHSLKDDLKWHLEQVHAFYNKPVKPAFYVLMQDSVLSGWGTADNKQSLMGFACATIEEADTVADNGHARTDMKKVRIVTTEPRDNATRVIEWHDKESAPRFYEKGYFRRALTGQL